MTHILKYSPELERFLIRASDCTLEEVNLDNGVLGVVNYKHPTLMKKEFTIAKLWKSKGNGNWSLLDQIPGYEIPVTAIIKGKSAKGGKRKKTDGEEEEEEEEEGKKEKASKTQKKVVKKKVEKKKKPLEEEEEEEVEEIEDDESECEEKKLTKKLKSK